MNMIHRRHRLKWIVGVTVSLTASIAFAGQARPPAPRPNLLLVYCDDLGYGDLGYMGHPIIRTPNIDRLAAGGLVLTNNYAGAPNCSPSRAALLTGRASHRVGLYDILGRGGREMQLPDSEITIAELLRDAGYDTYHGGKWHLNRAPKKRGPAPALRHGFQHSADPGMATDIVGDFAAWLKGRSDASKPFFAYLAFHESHMPVEKWAPPKFRAAYRNIDEVAFATIRYGGDRVERRASLPNRAVYYACVSQLDAAMGDLARLLEETATRERTFLYFSSDNGPEHRNAYSWGTPGALRGAKGHLHEGGIRVPGFVVWPGRVQPGSRSDEPVHAWDVLPTFCELAGVAVPNDRKIDGASFLPILAGQPVARKTPLYWSMWGGRGWCQYAMRDGDWKILAETEPLPKDRSVMDHIKRARLVRYELYNLQRDPNETKDLAPANGKTFERMKARFLELHEDIRAEGPVYDMEPARGKAPVPYGQFRSKRRSAASRK